MTVAKRFRSQGGSVMMVLDPNREPIGRARPTPRPTIIAGLGPTKREASWALNMYP